jgi:hypothetical protein
MEYGVRVILSGSGPLDRTLGATTTAANTMHKP